MIWPKLASVLIQSDPVLIRAHLCCAVGWIPCSELVQMGLVQVEITYFDQVGDVVCLCDD